MSLTSTSSAGDVWSKVIPWDTLRALANAEILRLKTQKDDLPMLHGAVINNRPDGVFFLIDQCRMSPNVQDTLERTALMVAVEHRKAHIVKLLIELKADCTMKDSEGRTALDYMDGFDFQSEWGSTGERSDVRSLLENNTGLYKNMRHCMALKALKSKFPPFLHMLHRQVLTAAYGSEWRDSIDDAMVRFTIFASKDTSNCIFIH
mmetsp:Transcript_32460/g.60381  ORF Transcript_32460/g.60381 Transcript_32460/m.60381 type:complete len:205 (-) Transcript_32460:265-879(-)